MRSLRLSTKFVVTHCSATDPTQDIGRKEIDGWHRAKKWDGIGYHFVVRRGGLVEIGEDLLRYGAHVEGRNDNSVAICLVGGVDAEAKPVDNFTAMQTESWFVLCRALRKIYPEAEFLGHRDLSPDKDGDGVIEPWEWLKQCPCFDVKERLNAFGWR